MVMEAEKSHSRPSASWRPRKASGVLQSTLKGLRTWGADGGNPSQRAEDEVCLERFPLSSEAEEER